MKVNLDKEALISLVKSTQPYYDIFNHFLIKPAGDYIGGFHDRWNWNESYLKVQTEDVLWDTYNLCRESWEKL